jgi:hypothetical protein
MWTAKELKEFVNLNVTSNTKFIGFSQCFASWTPEMEELCKHIKTKWPSIYLIAGAPAQPTYNSDYLDYYISGYGEEALKVLLKYLFSNGPRPKFDLNLSTKKKIIDALNSYPAYPCNEILIEYEESDYIQPDEWVAIENSRGCIFKCDFCSYPILGVKGQTARTQEDFDYQLRSAYDKWGITKFNIIDSTFNDNVDKVALFADVVEKLNFKPKFGALIRADLLINRPRDREELLRMNCLNHYYGIETFNAESSKSIHKGSNPEKIKQGLKDVRDFFVKNVGDRYVGSTGIIIGLVHETHESLENTMNWFLENWTDQAIAMQPLTIYTKEYCNPPSGMAADFKKYGYTEMSKEEAIRRSIETGVPLSYDMDPSQGIFPEYGVTPRSEVVWKHDTMDIFEAHKLWYYYEERMWWRDNSATEGRKILAELVVEGQPFLEWYKQKKLGR